MKSHIAQATPNSAQVATQTQTQARENTNEVPVIGNGGAGVAIALTSVILTRLSSFVDWKEIGKQWSRLSVGSDRRSHGYNGGSVFDYITLI